jgi:hypothetical protein
MSANLTLRQEGPSPKNSPLTNEEVDNNFINLNTELTAVDNSIVPTAQAEALILAIALG